MTLLEALHKHVSTSVAGMNPNIFFMIEDDDSLHESVLITPYGVQNDAYLPIGKVRFQIKCRAKTFPRSEDVSWKVYSALFSAPLSGADRKVLQVDGNQEPSYIGTDENGRYVHVFNVEIVAAQKGV